MLKLKQYYKPFVFIIILAIAFLFVQAMCDLKLPDYMSEIVNVGIQASGIEHVSPDKMSKQGLQLMQTFMNEEEKRFVDAQYETQDDIHILKDSISEENLEKLDHVFAISARTMMNVMTTMMENTNRQENTTTEENNSIQLDLNQIYPFLSMLQNIPENQILEAKENAEKTDASTLNSIGLVFTKAFYQELGMDISKIQIQYMKRIAIKMLGICLLGISAAIMVGLLASRVGAGLGRNLRKAIFEKVQSFSSKEFNTFSSASLITRTTNDVTQVLMTTVMMIRMLAYAPIMGIGSLIMMVRKTTNLMWTIVLACSCIIVLIIILFKTVLPKIKIVQKLTDKINLVAKESLSGLMVVRAFGTQKYEENRFDEVNSQVMKNNRFINRSLGIMMPFMMLIMNGVNLLILWFGANLIEQSTMQVGDLMAAMQYGIEVVMSFLFISMIFVMLPRASVSANRIYEVLSTEATILDPKKPKSYDESKKGYVEFQHVSFQYPGADEYVLKDIDFVAKPGQTTAIIGATGSGKTTIVNLIPRLFDATEGEVLVNGVNVKDVKQESLHNQIGFVPQKGNLLSGTIASNLKYGNENATDAFMEKCASIAQATEFIENKEDKYNSPISQGAKNVSGGQKQRLSIARALVKDAPIYVFDDSFSALDFKTDSNLRKALHEFAKDSTLIIVAQRVSTIMYAEQILVLDEGKIVGKGTHKELLENCPTYYEIASSQLSKEELENGRK